MQVRGVVTVLEAVLLVVAVLWPPGRLALAASLVAMGSVISHAPARVRHHSFLHGHPIESGGRG